MFAKAPLVAIEPNKRRFNAASEPKTPHFRKPAKK